MEQERGETMSLVEDKYRMESMKKTLLF